MSRGRESVSRIEIDAEALRRKYAEERAKRLRGEAEQQYVELHESQLVEDADPFVAPGFTRDPVIRDADALVIGGGFAGLLACANLRKIGLKDIVVADKAGDFGGTWYWNRYPGVSCDVESYIYLPLLEDTGFMPSMKYSPGKEIFEYAKDIGRKFDLYDDALFQTQVTALRWTPNAVGGRWKPRAATGSRRASSFPARACSATPRCRGCLGSTALPGTSSIPAAGTMPIPAATSSAA